MRTIGSALEARRGIGPGFDFLRIFLALSVLCTHSFLITQGERHQFAAPPLDLLHASILPVFFALSGFLITGSAMRLSLKNFLINRSIRIVPALAVDVCVSALLIGPLFTTEPLQDYFSAYEFKAYFANIAGIIHFVLPGVFEANPFPATVNGSLWTVPFEIGCYAIMSAYIGFGLLRWRWLGLAAAVVLAGLVVVAVTSHTDVAALAGHVAGGSRVATLLEHFVGERGLLLYVYFLIGCLFYVFRYSLPLNRVLTTWCAVTFTLCAFDIIPIETPVLRALLMGPVLVYLMVAIGLQPIPKLPLYSRGDYSYGIYLYGYPLQQALVAMFPQLISPWLHMAVSVPLATGIAFVSWHIVEKPILQLRRRFSFTARKGDEAPVRTPAFETTGTSQAR